LIEDDTYLVVSELFERYTLVVDPIVRTTSVYCEECEEWVAEYYGDQVSTDSPEELLGRIVEDHDEETNGEEVSFQPKHFYM
jgi:hypothetical protein